MEELTYANFMPSLAILHVLAAVLVLSLVAVRAVPAAVALLLAAIPDTVRLDVDRFLL